MQGQHVKAKLEGKFEERQKKLGRKIKYNGVTHVLGEDGVESIV